MYIAFWRRQRAFITEVWSISVTFLNVSSFDDQIFTCPIGQVNLNTLKFYLPDMEFYLPRESGQVLVSSPVLVNRSIAAWLQDFLRQKICLGTVHQHRNLQWSHSHCYAYCIGRLHWMDEWFHCLVNSGYPNVSPDVFSFQLILSLVTKVSKVYILSPNKLGMGEGVGDYDHGTWLKSTEHNKG